MKMSNFNLLKKLMMMTFSDVEAERNMAIGQANKILKSEGIDWNRVLDRSVKVIPDIEEAPPEEKPNDFHKEIEDAFAILDVKHINDSGFRGFIESLYDQWQRKGTLTGPQRAALFKSADKAKLRR